VVPLWIESWVRLTGPPLTDYSRLVFPTLSGLCWTATLRFTNFGWQSEHLIVLPLGLSFEAPSMTADIAAMADVTASVVTRVPTGLFTPQYCQKCNL